VAKHALNEFPYRGPSFMAAYTCMKEEYPSETSELVGGTVQLAKDGEHAMIVHVFDVGPIMFKKGSSFFILAKVVGERHPLHGVTVRFQSEVAQNENAPVNYRRVF
jgi:hypothetical protein